jgi:hypothetical protein
LLLQRRERYERKESLIQEKTDPKDFEKVLSDLDADIKLIQLQINENRLRERKVEN